LRETQVCTLIRHCHEPELTHCSTHLARCGVYEWKKPQAIGTPASKHAGGPTSIASSQATG
jgi:hypothetical protein